MDLICATGDSAITRSPGPASAAVSFYSAIEFAALTSSEQQGHEEALMHDRFFSVAPQGAERCPWQRLKVTITTCHTNGGGPRPPKTSAALP